MNVILVRLFAVAVFAVGVCFGNAGGGEGGGKRPLVLVTTFPLYQIARNVAEGGDGFALELLLAANAGCPHEYAPTPGEMARLAQADALVVNGLGMEEFLDSALERIGARVDVFDTSDAVGDFLPLEEHEDDDDHGHDHDHGEYNPHLFASPLAEAAMAGGMAEYFSRIDPEGAAVYRANAKRYADGMRALAGEMADAVAAFPNKRIVVPHGAFDYLARDIGLEIVAHTQAHGEDLSASQLLALTKIVRDGNVAAIAVEPQYSPRTGNTLAKETGLPVVMLDPVATGPENAPLDYFAATMRNNLDALAGALGAR